MWRQRCRPKAPPAQSRDASPTPRAWRFQARRSRLRHRRFKAVALRPPRTTATTSSRPAARLVHGDGGAEWIPVAGQNRHPCADAEPAGRRCARPRVVQETVTVVGTNAAVLGQTAQVAMDFRAGPHRDPPDQSRHQRHPAHGSGGAADRPERELRHFRRVVVRQPVHGERRHGQRERPRPGGRTSTSRTRSRKRAWRAPASQRSSVASAAASSTSSRSLAATRSAARSATRSPTTTGAR